MADYTITSISINKAALKKLERLCVIDHRKRGEEIAILVEQEIERREAAKAAAAYPVPTTLPEAA